MLYVFPLCREVESSGCSDGDAHTIAKENKAESWGDMLKITKQVKGKQVSGTSGLQGAFHCIWLPALSGVRDSKTTSLGHSVFYIFSAKHGLLRSLKVQRREMQVPHTSPTNKPTQLKLVLLKEVGHFMSWHITFMWSNLSLLEKQGN